MIDTGIERGEPPSGTSGSSAAALFQRQWRIYRKVVDNNYLFHREAYERLHNLLIAEVARPFYFLDVACGDASATVDALKGTQVAHYHGIDVSRSALDIAEQTLRVLSCPVNLYEGDFVQALKDWRDPVGVVWIGLSLHHVKAPMSMNNPAAHFRAPGYFALHRNENLTAAEMGNSLAMVFRHYRPVVTPEAAAKFWNLLPSRAANVVEFAS